MFEKIDTACFKSTIIFFSVTLKLGHMKRRNDHNSVPQQKRLDDDLSDQLELFGKSPCCSLVGT